MTELPYISPSRRPRPDADLAKVRLSLDWKTITIETDGDEAALGRIFMWLLVQVRAAGGKKPSLENRQKPVEGSDSDLCFDCPPVGYPTDITRCAPCPRRTRSP